MSEPSARDAAVFRRIVSRIAPYRPFSSGADRVDYARQQFVLAAAHENNGRLTSCDECRAICETLWGLALEREEIFSTIKALVRSHQLLRDADDALILSPASSSELAERIRISNEAEAAAFGEWENTVRDMAPSLDDEHLGQLREDLTSWIHRLIREFGVEAALLSSPEDPRYLSFMDRVEHLDPSFLPERDPGVMAVRGEALLAFVSRMTLLQRRYFGNLLTTAHLMSVFTLDPAALTHMQELLSGQLLFLDTNIVYSMLNLAGSRKYLAAKAVLDLSRQLGYRICVTPWTINEIQESVRSAHSRLVHSRGLQASATSGEATEAFVTAFRRMHRDNGITVEDFVELHGPVEVLLANEEIEVIADHCIEIEDQHANIDAVVVALERAGGADEKPRPVQEHDAKHVLLVRRRRGPGKRPFANAGCLFLTNDNALVRYAHTDLEDGELPFASSLENWGDIARNLHPRTTDYDKTMVDLLDTPIFSSATPATPQEISDALARISAYVIHPPTFSARVLLDSVIDAQAQGSKTAGDQASGVTRKQMALLEAQVTELRGLREVERAEHTRAQTVLSDALAGAREDLMRAQQQVMTLTARVRAIAGGESRVGAKSESSDDPLSELGQRVTRQEKIIQLLIAVLISVVGIAVLAVPLGTGWVSHGWPLIADIVLAGATFAGAYASRFGFKRTIAGITTIAAVLTIVAAVQGFVS
jgi:hypothetical protein